MEKTRKKYPIIGASIERFSQNQLPKCGQVLARLQHLKERNLSKHAGSTRRMMTEVLDEVYELWEKANISTIQKKNALNKAMKMWQTYVSITSKNPKRLCRTGAKELTEMEQECDTLFALATPRAVDLIQGNRLLTTEERMRDIEFYVDQKGDIIGKMTNRDRQYDVKMKKKRHRVELLERRAKHAPAQEDPLEGPGTMETELKTLTMAKLRATMRQKLKATVTSTRPETKRREGRRQL